MHRLQAIPGDLLPQASGYPSAPLVFQNLDSWGSPVILDGSHSVSSFFLQLIWILGVNLRASPQRAV